jgi:hypothetical protein
VVRLGAGPCTGRAEEELARGHMSKSMARSRQIYEGGVYCLGRPSICVRLYSLYVSNKDIDV